MHIEMNIVHVVLSDFCNVMFILIEFHQLITSDLIQTIYSYPDSFTKISSIYFKKLSKYLIKFEQNVNKAMEYHQWNMHHYFVCLSANDKC